MRQLSSIVAVLLLAPLAEAKTLVDLDLPVGAESPARAALAAVKARAAFFGGRGASLTVSRVHPIEGGQVVRVGQRHSGLRVLGAEVAVTIQRGRPARSARRARATTSPPRPTR